MSDLTAPAQQVLQSLSSNQQSQDAHTAAESRNNLVRQQMMKEQSQRNLENNLNISKMLLPYDKQGAWEAMNTGLKEVNRSVTFENFDVASGMLDQAAQHYKAGDMQAYHAALAGVQPYLVNIHDRERANQMALQAKRGMAEEQAKLVQEATEGPVMKVARQIDEIMATGQRSNNDPNGYEKNIIAPGNMLKVAQLLGVDPDDTEAVLKGITAAQTMVTTAGDKTALRASLYSYQDDAFKQAADIVSKSEADPLLVARARIHDLMLNPNRSSQEQAELLAKTAYAEPQLYRWLKDDSAANEKDRLYADVAQTEKATRDLATNQRPYNDAAATVLALQNLGVHSTQSFDTVLTPDEEKEFKIWKSKYAPNDSGADYDLRGAFKAGVVPAGAEAGKDEGHFPDTYKKPNHPTFSDQSIYAKFGNPGHWEGDTYVPGTKSEVVLNDEEMKRYGLVEGTRELQRKAFNLKVAGDENGRMMPGSPLANLQQNIQDGRATLVSLQRKKVGRVGDPAVLNHQIREFEAGIKAAEAQQRLLSTESPYAIADLEAELPMLEGRDRIKAEQALDDLKQTRDMDVKIVEDENARLVQRQAHLNARLPEAERKAKQEENAQNAFNMVMQYKGKYGLTKAIAYAASETGVGADVIKKRYNEFAGSGIGEATETFFKLVKDHIATYGEKPDHMQMVFMRAEAAKQHGVQYKDLPEIEKDPSQSGQMNVNIMSPENVKTVATTRTMVGTIDHLIAGFKPGYVGAIDKKLGEYGQMMNLLRPQREAWIAESRVLLTELRNAIYGASLTASEKEEAVKALPNEGMGTEQWKAAATAWRDTWGRKIDNLITASQQAKGLAPGMVPEKPKPGAPLPPTPAPMQPGVKPAPPQPLTRQDQADFSTLKKAHPEWSDAAINEYLLHRKRVAP